MSSLFSAVDSIGAMCAASVCGVEVFLPGGSEDVEDDGRVSLATSFQWLGY